MLFFAFQFLLRCSFAFAAALLFQFHLRIPRVRRKWFGEAGGGMKPMAPSTTRPENSFVCIALFYALIFCGAEIVLRCSFACLVSAKDSACMTRVVWRGPGRCEAHGALGTRPETSCCFCIAVSLAMQLLLRCNCFCAEAWLF